MLHTSIAQEYLGYAFKNNNLGQNIEAIYTDLLEYKQKLQTTIDSNDPESATKYSIGLLEYFSDVTLKALTKLLKDKCNILITKSIVNKSATPFDIVAARGLIAIMPDYNKSVYWLLSKLQRTGYLKIKPTTQFTKIINQLQEDYNSYDSKTGKLSIPSEAILMLEPNVLLFPERTCSGIESFTAKELTAITLHEIGHVYDSMFSILNMTNNSYKLNHMFMQFYNMSPSDIHKFIIRNQSIIEQDIKNDKTNNDLISQKEKENIIERINSIIESLNTSDVYNWTLINQVALFLFGKINAILLMTQTILKNTKSNIIDYGFKSIDKFLTISESYSKPSGNIEPMTTRTFDMSELNADTFVVVHGYQSYLISGLDKVDKIFNIIPNNKSGSITSSINLPQAIKFACSCFNIWYYLSKIFPVYIFPMSISKDTDRLLCERYENLLYNGYAMLKKSNIPSTELKEIMRTIEQTKKNIDNSLVYFSTRYIQKFWDTVLGIEPTKFILRLLHDANFTKELTTLLNTIDKMINNSLYYHSAKLKTLI